MNGKSQTFSVNHYPWNENGYRPKTTATLTRTEDTLQVHFVSWESPVRAVETEHNALVYRDSCVEFFAQFDPEGDRRYVNFEMNPNGAVYCAVNVPGGDTVTLPVETIAAFCPCARVYPDRWEVGLQIPAAVIQAVFPGYQHREGTRIRGNFYKCGDLTDHPHFGCWQRIDHPEPDFHRPEFFGDILL